MTYRIAVDRDLCSGFGSCVQLAPHLFRLDGEGASALLAETDDPRALEAAASCPMGAIAAQALERAA
jgi:ferredoxin